MVGVDGIDDADVESGIGVVFLIVEGTDDVDYVDLEGGLGALFRRFVFCFTI